MSKRWEALGADAAAFAVAWWVTSTIPGTGFGECYLAGSLLASLAAIRVWLSD